MVLKVCLVLPSLPEVASTILRFSLTRVIISRLESAVPMLISKQLFAIRIRDGGYIMDNSATTVVQVVPNTGLLLNKVTSLASPLTWKMEL